uniref:SWIM-type domain-containing protein n=1 Tax=Panagrolaimus superbus TaxID=310955 RepID=A0A914Z0G2_9BILA
MLRGKGRIYRELCIELFNELQQQPTAEKYDEKLTECLEVFDNDKIKKIFKYYGDKMKSRCSRYAILSAKLPDKVVDTQGAESLNAYIKRHKPKGSLFPDELIVILFYLSHQQYSKIKKGYYRHPQGYDLHENFYDKICGKPGEVPALAFVPGISEIVSFIRDKTTLPLMPGMKQSGPLTPYMGTENPNVPNALARELVARKRISQSQDDERHFLVNDLTDKLFAVYVRDKNLAKQAYECSCKSKNCIHLRAVFFFLGIPPAQIPFIALKDPLQSLLGNRNQNEKKAGEKQPRRGESKRDYDSDDGKIEDNKMDFDDYLTQRDDTSHYNKRKASNQHLDDNADLNVKKEENSQGKKKKKLVNDGESVISDMWDELQSRTYEEITPEETQLREDVAKR